MLKPLHNLIVIKRVIEDIYTTGGILLPSSSQDKPVQGEVLAVGPAVFEVKAGDTVMFGKFSGTEVKVDSETVLIMRESDIFAVIS